MRLLVACQQCRQQYDASKLKIGARFRCNCGAVLTVTEPRGHEASVVRCSSCGAPRDERALACAHCGADFTIHETDLHAVCPQCLARISERAKFCHHCGKAIAATQMSGERTSFPCPACESESRLVNRRLGKLDIAAAECQLCAGLWLGEEAFRHLTMQARENPLAEETLSTLGRAAGTTVSRQAEDGRWRYRNCPVCRRMMQRRHYARKSGVIIDICRNHGIWFDADELHRILKWIRRGGIEYARREVAKDDLRWEQSLESRRRAQQAADRDRTGGIGSAAWGSSWGDTPPPPRSSDLVEFVISAVFRF